MPNKTFSLTGLLMQRYKFLHKLSVFFRQKASEILAFCLSSPNKANPMRSVVTIRIPEEYVGMLEHIALTLQEREIEVKDAVLIKTVLLTGIRAINQMITQNINIFDDEGNNQADD